MATAEEKLNQIKAILDDAPAPTPTPWTEPATWDAVALEKAYKKAFYAAFHDDVPYMNNYASPAWQVLAYTTPDDPLFGVNNCVAYLEESRKLGMTAYDVLVLSHDTDLSKLYGTVAEGDPVKGAKEILNFLGGHGNYAFAAQIWTRQGRQPLNINTWGPYVS